MITEKFIVIYKTKNGYNAAITGDPLFYIQRARMSDQGAEMVRIYSPRPGYLLTKIRTRIKELLKMQPISDGLEMIRREIDGESARLILIHDAYKKPRRPKCDPNKPAVKEILKGIKKQIK